MRLEFELPVVVRARHGRAAAEKTVMGFVPHVAEIAESELRDAPLALAYQQPGLDSPSMQRVEYRALDGHLWTEVGTVPSAPAVAMTMGSSEIPPFFSGRKGVAEKLDKVMRQLSSGRWQPAKVIAPNSLVVHAVEKRADYRFEPLMAMPLQGDVEGQVVPQIEAFDTQLRDFVLIDGRVYRREPEPLIRLYPDGQWLSAGVERRGYARRQIRTPNALPRSVGWFRLDDRSGLAEEAEIIIAAMGDPGPLNDRISRIEVYDRSVLRASPEGHAIYDVADAMRRHFQAEISRNADGEEPGAVIGRWLAEAPIRDVGYFKAISGKLRGDPILDDVPTELEEAFMAIAEDETGKFANFTGTGRLRVFAREVARRWRDRPVSMDFVGKVPSLLF
ncbi:hypothetical protein OIU34_19850 [Pararhizobium sp. BT-229]|uniref:hypothetical protein n=1 Tax=Pararhizobium sp. BT-229 TaxID=2986923 RepID=UPI0021F725DD|nr:hypothetical protein [Pararhizobium sp. BT-229]MCV9964140.1 hypothetical protein [Pararhizobium sp. BT-229]